MIIQKLGYFFVAADGYYIAVFFFMCIDEAVLGRIKKTVARQFSLCLFFCPIDNAVGEAFSEFFGKLGLLLDIDPDGGVGYGANSIITRMRKTEIEGIIFNVGLSVLADRKTQLIIVIICAVFYGKP